MSQAEALHSRSLRVAAAVIAALGLLPIANWLTGGRAVPWWNAAAREWSIVGLGVVLLAYLLAHLLRERWDAWGAGASSLALAPSPRAFTLAAAALAFALSATASVYCFARQPHLIDEMAQLWHARILLGGRLFLPTEAQPEFFSAMNVLDQGGRWYSQFPIGGPALLALGIKLGAVWLLNPVMTAIAVACVYRLARLAYGEATGRIAASLMALSPFVVFMGGTQMSHVPALALTTLALLAAARWRESPARPAARYWAATAGASVGLLAAVRPLDGALVGVVVAAFQLPELLRRRERWADIALQIVAGAIPIALLLWSNAQTTGHPLRFGYDVMWGAEHGLGFHESPYGEPHTPRRALALASANLMRLDLYLFEWPIPALLPVVISLALVRRASRWDWLLLSLIGATVGAYALYWHEGFYLGPRFLFIAIPAFVILVARAPVLAAERLRGSARRAAILVLPLAMLASVAWPTEVGGSLMRARQYRASLQLLKHNLAAETADADLGRALVFVHEGWGARLMARMWAAGVSRRDAERLLRQSDACALEMWLRGERGVRSGDAAAHLARLASYPSPPRPRPDRTPDRSLRFADGAPFTPECAAELAADAEGVSVYPPFLALNQVGPDGRLGGDIVFARDLGPHNEALRPRFGDRAWYRYVPRKSPSDSSPAFVIIE